MDGALSHQSTFSRLIWVLPESSNRTESLMRGRTVCSLQNLKHLQQWLPDSKCSINTWEGLAEHLPVGGRGWTNNNEQKTPASALMEHSAEWRRDLTLVIMHLRWIPQNHSLRRPQECRSKGLSLVWGAYHSSAKRPPTLSVPLILKLAERMGPSQ